jgi:hypothetical protein
MMAIKKYFIIFMLLFVGCSSVQVRLSPMYEGVNDNFKPYVEHFKLLSKGYVTEDDFYNVTIGFKDIKDSAIGRCWITPWFREIDIDTKWWFKKGRTQLEREELMFHELGHCVLFRSHTEPTSISGLAGWFERILFDLGILQEKGYLKDGCPKSYMHPYSVDLYCIERYREHYIKELFDYVEYEELVEEVIVEEVPVDYGK